MSGEAIGRRLFKLEEGELGKVVAFSALAALIQAGIMVGLTAADTLFLSRVGFEKIPILYLATPLVMAVYVPVFALLISKLGTPRTLMFTLGLLVVGGGVLFSFIPGQAPAETGIGLIYYATRLYAELWYIALYTLFWNFADSFFDIQDAKRLFPLFSAGSAVGAVVGGGLVAVVAPLAGMETLFVVWAVIALVTLPLVGWIRGRFHALEEGDGVEEEEGSLWSQLRQTGQAIARSRFVLLLVATMFFVVFLTSINEYESLRILSASQTEDELGALLGRYLVVANIVNVVFSLFLFNRLVLSVGVGNVALVQPLAYLAVFYFLLFNGSVGAAFFGFLAYQGLLPAIEFNNQNFLFNAVPQSVKQQVRTVVEGLAEPFATAAAGALLLIVTQFMPGVRVSVIGFVLAGAYLALAFLLRNAYLPSLVTNLRRGWLDLTRPAREALAGLGGDEQERLREMVRVGDPELAQCALRILSINDPAAGHEATLEYLERVPADRITEARGFVESLLTSAGPEAARAFLAWVGEGRARLGSHFVEEMGGHGLILPSEVRGLLDSEDPSDVSAAVTVLWRSWDPKDRLQASEGLVRLLDGDDEAVQAGLRAVGRLDEPTLASLAASHLRHRNPGVRRQAMASLKSVVTPGSASLVPTIIDVLPELDDRGRYDAMEALARIGDPSCIEGLLEASVEFSPPVRRSVLRVLERMGLRGVPASVAVFTDSHHAFSSRIIAARFLGSTASPQLEAAYPQVIDQELERAARFREFRGTLDRLKEDSSGIRVLRRFYRDTGDEIVDFILAVLNIAGRLPSAEMLSSSLRSDLSKERANAMETIEQGIPRSLFKRLRPFLVAEGDPIPAATTPVERIVETALESTFPVEAAAAADALWTLRDAEALPAIRGRLPHLRGRVFRETTVRLAAGGEEAFTPVDVMDLLSRAPFFGSLPASQLAEIALRARVESAEPGTELAAEDDPADDVFLGFSDGREGEVRMMGGEALGSRERYTASLTAGEGMLLRVPVAPVFSLAEVSPRVGIELVRFVTRSYGVASL